MDNNRKGTQRNTDMTQRVPVQSTPHSVNSQRRQTNKWYISRKEMITLIALGSVTILLLCIAVGALILTSVTTTDDGRILQGVVAAGVNLGGLNKEDAKEKLREAAAEYSSKDMTVTVLKETIILSPSNTGASLDIDAVVEAAYNYGRTGSRSEREQAKQNALSNSVTIPITDYLNLNTAYINSEIDKLSQKFGTTLRQPTLEVTGVRPQVENDTANGAKPDTSTVWQRLIVFVGTAEYNFIPSDLYAQILEHYNIRVFKVVGDCPFEAPSSYEEELVRYYNELCVAPENAKYEDGYITSGKYGYGFNLNEVKELLANTPYGETREIFLTYLEPSITKESLSNTSFPDKLGESSAVLGEDAAWNHNVETACKILNGVLIPAGTTFSFTETLGEITADKYLEAMAYAGRLKAPTLGGGINQVASLLFTSALKAELVIEERHGHIYTPDFIEKGLDAYVDGTKDLKIRNDSNNAVCIRAEVVEGELRIRIDGVETRNYITDLGTTEGEAVAPESLYHVVALEYADIYQEGQIVEEGLTGYTMETYVIKLDKVTGEPITVEPDVTYKHTYEAKAQVVITFDSSKTDPAPTPDPTPDPTPENPIV